MLCLKSLDDNLSSVSSQLTDSSDLLNSTNRCSACMQPILEQYFLMIADRCWHSECLRCCLCQRPLNTSSSCFFKDGLIFCRQDYTTKYVKHCERCNLVLCCDDLVMRVKSSIFHLRCFTCIVCEMQLRPGQMFAMADNGTLYCQEHYEPINATSTSQSPKLDTADEQYKCRKQRCKKLKKLAEDNENVLDSLEYCGEENQNRINKSKRMRTSFKHHQLRTMKSYFNLNHNPDAKDLKQLAQRTGLTKRVLQVWFQNARAKFRRNTMQSRDVMLITSTTPHTPTLMSTDDKVHMGSKSVGSVASGSCSDTTTVGVTRSSLSPNELQKRNVAFCDTTNSIDDSDALTLKLEDDCEEQAEKSLAEYFESDASLL
uniref:LIM/homeobox protein Lhx9 n=1 Tax=Syphacia muris TaxID=451379 RepID=A0A0N5AL21_9BILA